ncbi:MAG TPA: serine protease [Nitrospinae bacterium]|nr:serine protease [Nitrospinota bacterium]HBA26274.1 serine protease [Nitrospinota bacterium]
MKKKIIYYLILLSLFFLQIQSFSEDRHAVVLKVDGVINPVSAEYIIGGIKEASFSKAELLIIQLDTPGGLDTSMRMIIKEMMASSVPIVVYVSPSGSRAASAGAFITIAAHIAAMSPGTNIGAAHPVNMGGNMDSEMSKKIENDASAYIISLAKKRGRNEVWAEKAVRKSVSISEDEAKKENIVDIITENLDTLLKDINGRKIEVEGGVKIINTEGVKLKHIEMSLRQKILDTLSNPNIAYMLMLLGFYGLFFELSNPGAILPGIVGAISLILAFYSFQTLPVNYAGLLLILLGIILFILEIKVVSYGALSLGGIISLVLGSMMLIESPAPYMKISLYLILPAAAGTAAFFLFLVGAGIKAQRKKPTTGKEGLVGEAGVAQSDIKVEGKVFIHGELWDAYSSEEIKKGSEIVVTGVEGLKLIVKLRS